MVELVYLCERCNDPHKTEQEAKKCCPREIERAWRCVACQSVWYRKSDAEECSLCAKAAADWEEAEAEYVKEVWR